MIRWSEAAEVPWLDQEHEFQEFEEKQEYYFSFDQMDSPRNLGGTSGSLGHVEADRVELGRILQQIHADSDFESTDDEMQITPTKATCNSLRKHAHPTDFSDTERNTLLKKVQDLEMKIDSDRQLFVGILSDKDNKIQRLKDEKASLVAEYRRLVDSENGGSLDEEIATYRQLLEGEERRIGLLKRINRGDNQVGPAKSYNSDTVSIRGLSDNMAHLLASNSGMKNFCHIL